MSSKTILAIVVIALGSIASLNASAHSSSANAAQWGADPFQLLDGESMRIRPDVGSLNFTLANNGSSTVMLGQKKADGTAEITIIRPGQSVTVRLKATHLELVDVPDGVPSNGTYEFH